MQLSPHDEESLAGRHGPAVALAMRVLVRSARLMGAERLLDIESAHIDGCLYHGQASLDFVERLVAGGGRVVVPTTLNVGSLDLIHPELFQGSDEFASQGRRLMEAHLALGCESSFTCAPYQLKNRPRFGQQIAWAESNAIVFANSVLGARTNRYGDFIDLCAALTGRAPASGLHLSQNRRGQVLFQLEAGCLDHFARDILFAALGMVVGRQAGGLVPVIAGLPRDASEDELKALGAACASSGAVAMFHALGITPEAPDLLTATGGRLLAETRAVGIDDLRAALDRLNQGRPGQALAAVSVGTPHFSLSEFSSLEQLVDGLDEPFRCPFYVNTSRFILWQIEESGLAAKLRRLGVEVVTDTCTYITPVMKDVHGLVMTNSGKWAHYAPANIGVEVAFGSLHDCVQSARLGELRFHAR